MTLELRVVSGARAGARERFEKSVISLGRHPLSDFRFDPQADLDVSTRHAELRGVDGVWTIHDQESTNGTFVNGERVESSRRLSPGDTIAFGANGPRMEVHFPPSNAPAEVSRTERPAAAVSPAPVPSSSRVRDETSERIAAAVHAQTASLRRGFVLVLGLLVVAGVAGFVWWQRQVTAREQELLSLIARSESASAGLERAVAAMRPRDSAFAAELALRASDAKRTAERGRRLASEGAEATEQSLTLFSEKVARDADRQRSITQFDFATVHDRNDPAVAMIASDLEGTFIAGTAFCVSPTGLLVTNRHVVRAESGAAARRVRVLFADTRAWLPAHVVRMSDTDDLALIQLDVEGGDPYPVVAGVSRTGELARVGAPIASIGYPHAVDTPMEGQGLHVTARTTTAAGTVAKRLDDLLQVDSYAGRGSSGSPLFDTRGDVVGVIYGGAPESGGRIVYAVPAQRLTAFLGAEGQTLSR